MKRILSIIFLVVPSIVALAQQSRQRQTYAIQDSVLIRTRDGGLVSAIVVRNKEILSPQPVILQFTIYVRNRDVQSVKESVDHGYVGVMAYTRGKKNSPNEIFPYEQDGQDAYDVIDWISKQKWCNGSVGMYGGSYNGFTQWAATKKLHPNLKTIVPYVANRPGMGLPMENNIFINPNYEWAFYVSNNKALDTVAGNDRKRFRQMQFKWWRSGRAYKRLDSIDGVPNKWFQRWIKHPGFDDYWQHMAPVKDDFSQINIPTLSFDGYYNDSQISSLYYLREHAKYRKDVEDYLIIGPYSHFGAQHGGDYILQGYNVDSIAIIDTRKITYEWFDYILRGAAKPSILKDKINYEVMGANKWEHAPSLERMSNSSLKLFLTNEQSVQSDRYRKLSNQQPVTPGYLSQEVNLVDRTSSTNNNYYPDPIVRKDLDMSSGYFFISEPLPEGVSIAGAFSGEIKLSINKKDVDLGIVLYEAMPNGEYFELSYFMGRASYAYDITTRKLLTPEKIETVPFSNTRLINKQLGKGSRLLVELNVNKNPFNQLNYGTGKDVSDETIKDALAPLIVKWYSDSFVKVPINVK